MLLTHYCICVTQLILYNISVTGAIFQVYFADNTSVLAVLTWVGFDCSTLTYNAVSSQCFIGSFTQKG